MQQAFFVSWQEAAQNMRNRNHTFYQNMRIYFHCALCVNNKVTSSPVADFLVDGHTFEVGGKSKKQKQIKGTEDAFVVKDDTENAYLNILPLWSFGFNY